MAENETDLFRGRGWRLCAVSSWMSYIPLTLASIIIRFKFYVRGALASKIALGVMMLKRIAIQSFYLEVVYKQ